MKTTKKSSEKKASQLGMPHGTAANRLRKLILFDLIKQLDMDYCFQCGCQIENVDELSIEHKVPYLDSENPKELYFDLSNIAFSHLTCNTGAARQTKIAAHPSAKSYAKGCRCDGCTKANRVQVQKYRNNKKLK